MARITVLAVSLLFALILAAALPAAAALPEAMLPAAMSPDACDWSGVWLPFEGEWRLAQNGTRVSGSYLDGKGFLSGTVDGDVLRGEWKEPPSYDPPFEAGHFKVTMTADCGGFVGTWGLGDAECCNVLSAIRFEDAPPVPAVEVERGTLTVEGQTIPAGDTYFPPGCPSLGRAAAEGCITFMLGDETGVKLSCFLNRLVRVLLVLEKTKLAEEDSELLIDMIAVHLRERCGFSAARQGAEARQDDWALDLAVRQGSANVTGVVEGQTVSVAAGPATSMLGEPGSFAVGYVPAAGKATFQTYSSPLGVRPQGGGDFTLPPFSRVEVTAGGPGPVTPLPHLYLPMLSR